MSLNQYMYDPAKCSLAETLFEGLKKINGNELSEITVVDFFKTLEIQIDKNKHVDQSYF